MMLSDRVCQMLTAYVDGELSERQRTVVERLLRRSAEARSMVERLQQDSSVLRGLPRRRLSRDFSERVLHTIAERKLNPARRAAVRNRQAYPVWTGLAVAAAVLLVLGICSYFYFALATPDKAPIIVDGNQDHRPERPKTPEPTSPSGIAKVETKPKPIDTSPEPKPDPGPDTRPKPAPEPPSVIGSQDKPPTVVEEIKPRIPLSFPLRDLAQEESRERLHEELHKGPDHHLELFCLDRAKAFERLRSAFEHRGIHLLVDEGLKNKGFKTDYLFYGENLTPDELSNILVQLGTEDKQAERTRHGQFGKLIVLPMAPEDDQKLLEWGIDSKQLQQPKPKTPFGVDIHKPLSQATAEEVAQAAAGQGPPRPVPGKPLVKASEPLALVMPYAAGPRSGLSREVRQLLDSRKDRRPGAIQMFLVVHSINS